MRHLHLRTCSCIGARILAFCDICAGVGELVELENDVEESKKTDGEVDVLLMERDSAGVAVRVLAIAEMKSGIYDLACGQRQHERCVCVNAAVRLPQPHLQQPHTLPQKNLRSWNEAVHRKVP